MPNLNGIIPPVVTPMKADESVDIPSLKRVIEHLIDGGVRGLFMLGSMGEFDVVTPEEKPKVIETAVEVSRGRVPVLAGIGESGTKRVIRAARDAQSAGADALVAILPFYLLLRREEDKKKFFLDVADAVDLPLVIYENPHTTKISIGIDTLMELSADERFIATKDSSRDMDRFSEILRLRGKRKDFGVFQGSERLLAVSLMMGADGAVPSLANLVPRKFVVMYDSVRAGKLHKALAIQRELRSLMELYFHEDSSSRGGLKYALSLLGLCKPYTGSPHPQAGPAARRKIRRSLKQHSLI